MHRRLRLTDLREGMVLHADVCDRRGRLLAPAGTRLTPRQLDGFAMWRVDEAEVVVESDRVERADRTVRTPAHMEPYPLAELEEQHRALFANADLDNPFAAALFVRCQRRRSERGYDSVAPLPIRAPGSKTAMSASGSRPAPGALDWVRKTTTLPSLPAVYHRLVAVMDHPRSSSADIAKVLREDTGLASRLLRLVNSAMFAFPGRIEVVSHALSLVGTAQVRDLALATSVLSAFTNIPRTLLDMESFWRHSLACAISARTLAKHRGEDNVERYFVAGMLHDVGRLVTITQRPEVLASALKAALEHGVPLHHAERDVLGHTTAEVGAVLLEAWNIPWRQRDAVAHQHTPERAGPHAIDASIIHLANAIAIAMQIGTSGERRVPPIAPFAWQALALPIGLIDLVVDEVDFQLPSITDVILRSP